MKLIVRSGKIDQYVSIFKMTKTGRDSHAAGNGWDIEIALAKSLPKDFFRIHRYNVHNDHVKVFLQQDSTSKLADLCMIQTAIDKIAGQD